MTGVERMVVAGGGRYGGGRSHRRQRWLQEATRMEGGTSSLFVVVVEVGSEKQEAVERGGQISEKERADVVAVVRGKRRW